MAVLVAHGMALQWLTQQAQGLAALRLMAAPMFTRMLQQQAPSPPPVVAADAARIPPATAALQSVEVSTAQGSTTTVATPVKEVESSVASSAPDPSAAREPDPPGVAIPEPAIAALTAPDAIPATPTTSVGPTPVESAAESTATNATPSLAAAGAAPLDSWPPDTRLSYKVGGFFRGELHGTARVQWQREGDGYQTRVDIDLGLVSLVMTSQGQVTPQGLLPKAYEETRAGKRRSVSLQDSRVVLTDGSQVARPAGVQDTASQFVELSHRFSSGQQPLEVGGSVSFWMARPGGIDLWTYDVFEKVILKTPELGPVEAFHLKPRPLANPRGNVTAEMWFAPSLQYLPVRIKVSLGDAFVDLFAQKIEQR